jgi:triphosphoribosyl-dephospho-CoA synthetase
MHSGEELRAAVETIAARGGGRRKWDDFTPARSKLGNPLYDETSGIGAPIQTLPLDEISSVIGRWARTAVLYEAAASPKPGLVTPFSNGSHSDMDYFTFLASAAAIAPFWEQFARLGVSFAKDSGLRAKEEIFVPGGGAESALPDPAKLLSLLRKEGMRAEQAMFAATVSVNTHKGLVFSLGVLCAAAGLLIAEENRFNAEKCVRKGAMIVRGIVERDFAGAEKKAPAERTAGERLYLSEGVAGIRGEAERGFPSVAGAALPHLRKLMAQGYSLSDSLTETLFVLMLKVEDTNILARGGREGERLARRAASRALELGAMNTEEGRSAVREMDSLFAEHRLSPGGSADLLAVTVFLYLLEESMKSGQIV